MNNIIYSFLLYKGKILGTGNYLLELRGYTL